ncbi:MAG: transcriptional repressor [Planctomycetes bacterium]|nr:transcriptional repressor [Planctomycetota bacterium]
MSRSLAVALTTPEVERRMEAFRASCARAGVRITPQRVEIFREVARTDEHPDAEKVFRRVRGRLSNVSLDTVYRTLALLEELGLVCRVDALCDRARFDANRERHHHFVCTRCGAVRDFAHPEWDRCAVPEEVKAMGEVRTIHVQLRGLCSKCAARERKGGRPSRSQMARHDSRSL